MRLQLRERVAIEREPPALVEHLAVPREPRALERAQNFVRRARRAARPVEVFDAHEPPSTGRARVEPARGRCNERARVQRPGRRWREPSGVHGVLEYTAAFFGRTAAVATVELTQENFEHTVNGNAMVIIDFWAPWCGPCRGFAPVYEQASQAHPDVVFAKVNTDEQQDLAGAFGIRSIPTLIVFREKVILFQQPGALPGAQLEQVITQAKTLDMAKVHAEVASQQQANQSASAE